MRWSHFALGVVVGIIGLRLAQSFFAEIVAADAGGSLPYQSPPVPE